MLSSRTVAKTAQKCSLRCFNAVAGNTTMSAEPGTVASRFNRLNTAVLVVNHFGDFYTAFVINAP